MYCITHVIYNFNELFYNLNTFSKNNVQMFIYFVYYYTFVIFYSGNHMKDNQLFDNLSLDILRELNKNGRMSYRNLSRKFGVSTVTIIDRIKKLEKEGVIVGYSAKINKLKLGYEFMGIVKVSVSKGSLLETQKKISSFSGVVSVYDITGEYDSIVFVSCKTRYQFSKLVKRILSVPKVERTNTSVILNIVKESSFIP